MYSLRWIFEISSDEDIEHICDLITEHNQYYMNKLVIKSIVQNKQTGKYYLEACNRGETIQHTLAILKKVRIRMYSPLEVPLWWKNPTYHHIIWLDEGGKLVSPFQ